MSFSHCLALPKNQSNVYVSWLSHLYGEGCQQLAQPSNWRTTPSRLSAIVIQYIRSYKKRHAAATGRLRLKCDDKRAETRFRLSAKRMSPFKSAGASVQSTTGSRGVRLSCSNAGYTMFRDSVKSTGYPQHSRASPCTITFQLDSTHLSWVIT